MTEPVFPVFEAVCCGCGKKERWRLNLVDSQSMPFMTLPRPWYSLTLYRDENTRPAERKFCSPNCLREYVDEYVFVEES